MRERAHKRAYFTGLFIANELLDTGCRFRFQCGTGHYPIDLSGFNWDRNPGSVPIKTEDMVRSGEASLWFNPTSHVLVQPFAYKKLCENVSAFRFKCGARRG
jgi:hypothetical protein